MTYKTLYWDESTSTHIERDATPEEVAQIEKDLANGLARQAEEAKTQYQRDRAAEYPPIGDQLDALFKAGVFPEDMAAMIQAVKDKYPKG